VLIKGAGHLPYLSHPREFNGALHTFLTELRVVPP
jgi:pimeloyl-ACP methyl ester carboxylesterase